jgi:hypothetical protein
LFEFIQPVLPFSQLLVIGIDRNPRSTSIGIRDRHHPESAIDIDRNPRSASSGIRDRHETESVIVISRITHNL